MSAFKKQGLFSISCGWIRSQPREIREIEIFFADSLQNDEPGDHGGS